MATVSYQSSRNNYVWLYSFTVVIIAIRSYVPEAIYHYTYVHG